jgi:sugar O-acyltransferase (sialic acid O-acetyltransferase NeuD family)
MKNKIKNIVVIGGGGYSKVLISLINKINNFNIVGFTDTKKKHSIFNIPYLGTDEEFLESNVDLKTDNVVIGIGQLEDVTLKKRVISKFRDKGYKFPVIKSVDAIISEDVEIGMGTIIRDGANIGPSTKIGDFSIIGNSVNINHDSLIGSFSNIAVGSNIGVNVEIKNEVFIGMGTIIINDININQNVFIGAGSLVNKNCVKSGLYFGSPAKFIRKL